MSQADTDPSQADALIGEIAQWLREEVAPVARSGHNWKVIINGKGVVDWSFVVEKHGGRRRPCSQTTETMT